MKGYFQKRSYFLWLSIQITQYFLLIMYIFVNEIQETSMGDFHRSLCFTNPESFVRFENNRYNRGRDPMEYPTNRKFVISRPVS